MASFRTKTPGKLTLSSKFQTSTTKSEEKTEKVQLQVGKAVKVQPSTVGKSEKIEVSVEKMDKGPSNVEKAQMNVGKTDKFKVNFGKQDKSQVVGKMETTQTVGKTEKVQTVGKTEKVQTVRKTEKVQTVGKTEKVQTVVKTEKIQTVGKTEKVQIVGKTEKVQPNVPKVGGSQSQSVRTEKIQDSKLVKNPVESKSVIKMDASDKKGGKMNISYKFQKETTKTTTVTEGGRAKTVTEKSQGK